MHKDEDGDDELRWRSPVEQHSLELKALKIQGMESRMGKVIEWDVGKSLRLMEWRREFDSLTSFSNLSKEDTQNGSQAKNKEIIN